MPAQHAGYPAVLGGEERSDLRVALETLGSGRSAKSLTASKIVAHEPAWGRRSLPRRCASSGR